MNIEQAKRIRLDDFLQRLGHSLSRRSRDQLWFLSPFRNETVPSFKVNTSMNTWYDFGLGEGGDIIDLVKRLEQLSTVSDTLARIEEISGSSPLPPQAILPATQGPSLPVLELTRVGPVKANSLLTYLRSRGIDPVRVSDYVHEVHYRKRDDCYFALGFANHSGGYELRNPYFKGTLGGKDISSIAGDPSRVLVFEGFFDFLTLATLSQGLPDASIIVLNSVSMREKAVEAIRTLKPTVVELFCDHDSTGQHLADYFRSALPNTKLIDRSSMYQGFNDLNEWHVANSLMQSTRQYA